MVRLKEVDVAGERGRNKISKPKSAGQLFAFDFTSF
jgi:hypothetical protein